MTKLTRTVAMLLLFCPASTYAAPGVATPELRKEILKKADDWSVPQPKAAQSGEDLGLSIRIRSG